MPAERFLLLCKIIKSGFHQKGLIQISGANFCPRSIQETGCADTLDTWLGLPTRLPMALSLRFLWMGARRPSASRGAFTCDSPLFSSVQNVLCLWHQRQRVERVMTARRPMLALAALLAALGSLWWFVGRADHRAEPQLPDEICFVAPAVPYDPRSRLPLHAPRPVPANARCPVCGVLPSRVPEWAAQLIFANGDAYFFDSPLSLFIYLRNLQRYAPGRQATDIAASYVHATGDGGWVAAQQAVYVWGSAVPGPMRRGNLPAFRNLADARQFIARNGGVVMRPVEITAQRLQDLEPHRVHRAVDHG